MSCGKAQELEVVVKLIAWSVEGFPPMIADMRIIPYKGPAPYTGVDKARVYCDIDNAWIRIRIATQRLLSLVEHVDEV